jgi:thiamine pyrophosphate-dependent acetolactate synthase large subunit-like protein
MVTAGPGVTNTVTAVANASVARVPLLVIGGCPPRAQDNMGAADHAACGHGIGSSTNAAPAVSSTRTCRRTCRTTQ